MSESEKMHWRSSRYDDETQANAALISAAPDLLAACEALLEDRITEFARELKNDVWHSVPNGHGHNLCDVIEKARAALTKATPRHRSKA
jgi:hypothetical protein